MTSVAVGGVRVLGGTGQLGAEVVKARVASGKDVSVLAKLSKGRSVVGAVTRDGLARLTRDCLGNPEGMNVIFHAEDANL